MSTPVTYKVLVTGRVQGVSFRASMREAALRLGVHGWVRNTDDGSVEAVLQGEAERVDELLDWARRGPPGAKVTSLRTEKLETYPHQYGFRIVL